ncbi:lantibiotic dehydratase [Melittangium boletus]|uniref:Lanthionine biosynthesis protein n=1 Tax=Melittangium boletus DSM 14713 TaxID=1294270 RepID=A0A286NVG7_9BACT|nr:lantibiotic dehydratase [Melittangium boletus]ATB27146.1 lanthionine biosynthesis protein [Melittangium boletus DSM 14713]
MSEHASGIVPSGFFALRTPLLSFDALGAWGEGLEAPAARPEAREEALARDRVRLRERLRRWAADPLVREALFVASPMLMDSLPAWESAPESERGQKVERTLVRYFARMAGRATPFGLFAGLSVGHLAERTHLHIPGRMALRRHTRLDMDYVCALVERVRREPEVRRSLRYLPNSSLYRLAGQWRYLEMRSRGRERSYHLTAVESAPHLEATLERAGSGATLPRLASALVDEVAGVSYEEALAYVETLVREQLLLPTWAPTLTGPEPVPHLLEQARDVPALNEVHERLSSVQRALALIDAQPLGLSPDAYREVAHALEPLPVPVELPRLFQVDMFRSIPDATLSSPVVDEMLRGLEALRRMTPRRSGNSLLERFRQRFLERYESRCVPLAEALDEENGVGAVFSRGPGRSTGPLLGGFVLPRGRQEEEGRWSARWAHLLRRLEDVRGTDARELELTDEDLKAMEIHEPVSLPDAFGVVATLVGESAEAVDQGRFQLLLENLHGPSAGSYLGRFCHGEPALEARVREHLRAEEALRPDVLFAEVVHLPQDRMGNVTCRPRLRPNDLVFLGESGAGPEQRILLSDLWVSVEGSRVVLRSKRLGREIVPRMSNAHNYASYGLNIYRFLGQLQHTHASWLQFSWGPLARSSFLPRVVYGRTVLSLACWNMEAPRLEAWGRARDAERFDAVQRFRHEARLPRWICLRDEDNQLPIDLDNVLSVDTLVQAIKDRPRATLEELFPGPEALCARGEEGGYVHELVVPFVRTRSIVAPSRPMCASEMAAPRVRRGFAPGSEWLYLKLHAGPATLDRLLAGSLGEAIEKVLATGAAERWFFLRYWDPDAHLRLRFQGEPRRLEAEVWPLLRSACAAAMEAGHAWRLQWDTYEREVERYGGPVGIELAEALFQADSDAVLSLLRVEGADTEREQRWRLTLQGMDALLDALGFSLERKLEVVSRARAGFGTEFQVDKSFEVQLGERYRRESRFLETSLSGDPPPVWARRGERLRPVVERLLQAEREGMLDLPLEVLADSYLHLHVNRMLTDESRPQELILHDFLTRLYRSRLARLRKGR